MKVISIVRTSERGSAAIIGMVVVVLLIIGFAAFQIFPLYWDHWNLEESVTSAMKLELVPPYEEVEKAIRTKILYLLDEMGASYDEQHIIVTLAPNIKRVQAEIWYARPHSLPFYQNPKQFYLKVEQKAVVSPVKEKITIPTPKQIEIPGVTQ